LGTCKDDEIVCRTFTCHEHALMFFTWTPAVSHEESKPTLSSLMMIPTHAPCACICCRLKRYMTRSTCIYTYMYRRRQIQNQTEPNESNHTNPPAGFNMPIQWSRTRACGGSATRSSLPPGNQAVQLAVPESKATLAHPLGSSRSHQGAKGKVRPCR
jgi:hypothetical protein